MEYKYNAYTCDVEFEYKLPKRKLFKTEYTWIKEKASLNDFMNHSAIFNPINKFVIATSIEDAKRMLLKWVLTKEDFSIHSNRVFDSKEYKVKNVTVINVRKKSITSKEASLYPSAEDALAFIGERLNTVNILNLIKGSENL